MIKYDLFRTTDGTLHRVNLCGGILDSVDTLHAVGWRQNRILEAFDFYAGQVKVKLIARNVVFKARLCSQ